MNAYYVATVLGSSLAMVGAVAAVRGNIFLSPRHKLHFQMTFVLLLIVNFSEMVASQILAMGRPSGLFHVFKVLELSLSPAVPMVLAGAIARKSGRTPALCLGGFNLLLVLQSLVTGTVYSIDSTGAYHRGILYPLMVLCYLLAFLYLIWESFVFCRDYQVENYPLLFMVFAIALAGISMPLAGSKVRLDWTFISLSGILFYIYVNQLIVQSDDLTKLLNRTTYDSTSRRLRKPALILVLDVDDMKQINESYGHLYGDECLQKTGENIRNVFSHLGYCYRTDGDRFCVILTEGMEEIQLLIERLEACTRLEQQKNPHFPNCAWGYAQYTPGREQLADAYARADHAMYQNKQRRIY